jgi:hypothetical protein
MLPNDEQGLQFARSLMDLGIVVNTAPDGLTESATKAAYEMLGDIGNNRVYGFAIVDGFANIPEEGRPWGMKSSDQRVMLQSPFECRLPLQMVFDKDFRAYAFRRHDSEIETWLDQIRHHLGRMVSPNTDYTVQKIRGVFYWSLAEEARLAFSPDLLRADWLSKWLHELKKSHSQDIYSEVATAFLADAKDLLSDTRPAKLLLPPIPALLLDRSELQRNSYNRASRTPR